MEKTINIAGVPVKLKSTAATPFIYKAQFGRDYIKDLLKMASLTDLQKAVNDKGELDVKKLNVEDIEKLDLSVFYNYLWALAKNADSSIPEPIEWFGRFDSLDLGEVMPELENLLSASLVTSKK